MTEVKYNLGDGEIIAEYDENGIAKITRECFEALIEKQIPKKPRFEHRRVSDLYVCECGNSIIMYKPYYCHYCGQKLDWSVEE